MTPNKNKERALLAYFIILCCGLFVTGNFTLFGNTVRVAASDFALILSPFVLFSYRRYLDTDIVFFIIFTLISVWLLVSIRHSFLTTGEYSYWAIKNKFIGWICLSLYFFLGLLLGRLSRNRFWLTVMRFFILFGCGIALFAIISFLPQVLGLASGSQRIIGMLVNPNAFGLMSTVCFFLTLLLQRNVFLNRGWLRMFALVCFLISVYYSGSKTAFLAFTLTTMFLFIFYRATIKNVLLSGSMAALICGLLAFTPFAFESMFPTYFANLSESAFSQNYNQTLMRSVLDNGSDLLQVESSFKHRLEISKSAFELFKTDPMMGVGLGTFLWTEITAGRGAAIHSTYLWLLTETGVIGVTLFMALFAFVFYLKITHIRNRVDVRMNLIGLTCIIIFAISAITMESMYQRYFWLLVGASCACSWPKRSF